MECVCGCGRAVPGKRTDTNILAGTVALELFVWDRSRGLGAEGPPDREGLIARGAECYQRLLLTIHGESPHDHSEECREWLAQAEGMRAGNSSMTKRSLFTRDRPNVSDEDVERLDRRHPERSFTGRATSITEPESEPPATTTAAPAAAPDLVEALERLRALRDDGTLTEDEFVAAKARLLDRRP